MRSRIQISVNEDFVKDSLEKGKQLVATLGEPPYNNISFVDLTLGLEKGFDGTYNKVTVPIKILDNIIEYCRDIKSNLHCPNKQDPLGINIKSSKDLAKKLQSFLGACLENLEAALITSEDMHKEHWRQEFSERLASLCDGDKKLAISLIEALPEFVNEDTL